jgi:hypothetical protein
VSDGGGGGAAAERQPRARATGHATCGRASERGALITAGVRAWLECDVVRCTCDRRQRAQLPSATPCPASHAAAAQLVATLLGADAKATFDVSNEQYTGAPTASGILYLNDTACDHYMASQVKGDAIVLTTGSMEIAARTVNTDIWASVNNSAKAGGTSLLGSTSYPSHDAATLSFTLTPKVNGKLK